MLKIKVEQLPVLFERLASKMDLYMPLHKNGQANYGIYTEGCKPAFDVLNTVKSPKDFFFPQSETLYTCYLEGKKISITPEELQDAPFAIFGIRPCDVKGVEILDKVFLCNPVDKFYKARREHGILISMACHEPEETCFCKAFGIDAANPIGDVATWLVGDTLYWNACSEKGTTLTNELADLFEETDSKEVEAEKEAIQTIIEKLPYSNISLDKFKNADLMTVFNSPTWDNIYKGCLACGTCTFICPTCQCYDIKDYNTGSEIKRFRCWDSCMYSDFTLMAHGNNRKSQKERFRQRFMHKLMYYPENNDGVFSCVGCGRCVQKCPSSLNILKVIKNLEVPENE